MRQTDKSGAFCINELLKKSSFYRALCNLNFESFSFNCFCIIECIGRVMLALNGYVKSVTQLLHRATNTTEITL